MTSLVEHARRELELSGQMAESPAYAQSIIAAVAALTSWGHSGGSMDEATHQLDRILRHENLSPLTGEPDEWADRSAESGRPLWQNLRNPKAFSDDAGRTWYFLDVTARYRAARVATPDLTIRLSDEAAEALALGARESGVTQTEAMRRAISAWVALRGLRESGHKILAEDQKKRIDELNFTL